MNETVKHANSKTVTPIHKGISVIFPAFNEAENIEESVKQCVSAMSPIFSSLEIIVVNDGSKDETANIINRLSVEEPSVVAIHHEGNLGYGAALRSGIDRASKDFIFFTDADLQFNLDEITHLSKWIQDWDIVAGYRAKRADPIHRRINAAGWNILVRLVLGLKVTDIDCAFKLFRREVFDTIRMETVGAMINTEILSLANLHGMKIKEVPVSHFPRTAGTQTGANIRVICKALMELFAISHKLRTRIRTAKAYNISIPKPAVD